MPIDREGEGPPLRKAETKPDDATSLRATPFTEDVFDDEYYRGRGRAVAGSPLGLIIGVVFGAVLAGGAAWFVLKDQSFGGANSAGSGAVIKADTAPYKIKPESPGGMQVANQDKTVYDRVAKSDAPNRVENLLPPAEQPKTPPKAEPKAEPKEVEPKPVEPPVVVKSPLDEKRDELAAMIAALDKKNTDNEKSPAIVDPAPAPAKKAPTPLTPAPSVTPPSVAKDEVPKPIVPKPAPLQPEPPQAEPAAVAPPGVASASVNASPASAGVGLQIQLAAAKSEEGAMGEWNRIKNKYASLVGNLTPNVVRADLGDRGVFFRLRAGMLPDKAAADALCAALTAEGNACLVVKP